MHVSPEAHTCPQVPQLLASFWVFVQLLLQQVGVLPEQQIAPQALALSQHPVLVQVLPVGQPKQGGWLAT